MLTARDVMTTPVKTVAPDDDVSEVLTRLAEAKFSGFPVVEDGKVVGVVTEEDLVDLFQPSHRKLWIPIGIPPFIETLTYGVDVSWDKLDVGIDFVKNANKPIREVVTTDVVTVGPDDDINEIVDLLGDPDLDVNRLPVVEGDELVGIVTRQDVLAALRDVDL